MQHVVENSFLLHAKRAVLAGMLALAGCNGTGTASIPLSGISGPDGGAEEAIYYDAAGHAHFHP